MLPRELKPELFAGYPPEARKLAEKHLAALRALPLSFLPSLLREVIDYDFKFPAERRALEQELGNLLSLTDVETHDWFQAFSAIKLSTKLEHLDWVNSPSQFVEELSAHLWSTHQLDDFRRAATEYADRLRAVVAVEPPSLPRLGISVIGGGVASYNEPLFRKLRPQGAYFSRVRAENGLTTLLSAITARAKAQPLPYAHWYVEGGEALEHDAALTCVSYAALEPARAALLERMRSEISRAGMGPEMLRTLLAQLRPAQLGMKSSDAVLDRFQVRLLTEGSGTQIFSTSFAQWAAREVLRRAQPLSLLVRFAPRQRQKPMSELLSPTAGPPELDFVGSLVDADMGAYYNWLNQQRLSGAEKSMFLVWFEDHNAALAISPTMPRGTESTSETDLVQLLSWMT